MCGAWSWGSLGYVRFLHLAELGMLWPSVAGVHTGPHAEQAEPQEAGRSALLGRGLRKQGAFLPRLLLGAASQGARHTLLKLEFAPRPSWALSPHLGRPERPALPQVCVPGGGSRRGNGGQSAHPNDRAGVRGQLQRQPVVTCPPRPPLTPALLVPHPCHTRCLLQPDRKPGLKDHRADSAGPPPPWPATPGPACFLLQRASDWDPGVSCHPAA